MSKQTTMQVRQAGLFSQAAEAELHAAEQTELHERALRALAAQELLGHVPAPDAALLAEETAREEAQQLELLLECLPPARRQEVRLWAQGALMGVGPSTRMRISRSLEKLRKEAQRRGLKRAA